MYSENNHVVKGWADYELIDSGDKKRLERWGSKIIVRPDPTALWKPSFSDDPGWTIPDLRYVAGKEPWSVRDEAYREGWEIGWEDMRFLVRPTPFRHLGLFPEQANQWSWLRERVSSVSNASVLNLFAYTGAASVVAGKAGAKVCHVDAAKGSVYWAKDNARLSGVPEDRIRWIVDDVVTFMRREVRRSSRYDLIMMDPPVFGRGPKGQIWRLEEGIGELVDLARQLLTPHPLGILINFYATDLYPESVVRIVQQECGKVFPDLKLRLVGLEESKSKKVLQTGYSISSS